MSGSQSLKFPIEIGTKVIIVPWGNNARGNIQYQEAEIVKIGRKYFYVAYSKTTPEFLWKRFDRESYLNRDNDLNGGYYIWPDKASYLHYKEMERKYDYICEYFRLHFKKEISDTLVDMIYSKLVTMEGE